MSAPAINTAPTAPGAQGPAATSASGPAGANAGVKASAAFSALLGMMFGDQDSLAAQLFAGAKAGTKTSNGANADGKPGDANTDLSAQAQAQGLAAGFMIAPAALVDQAQATAAAGDGAAVDPNATGKTPGGSAVAALPADAEAQGKDAVASQAGATPASATASATDAKPAPQPTVALATGAVIDAQANAKTGDAKDASAQTTAQSPAGQASATAIAAAAAAGQANAKAAAPADKTSNATSGDKTVKAADAVGATTAPQAAAIQAAADPNSQGGAGSGADKDGKPALPQAEAPKESAAADRRDAAQPLQIQTAAVDQAAAPAATPVRATSETVAHLAAQISKQLDGRSTQFDIQLSPAGLGHVGVRVEISAHGQLTAAMSFDNAHAAAEVRSRAAELTRALEQAGFDVSGGLSFDVASDQGRSGYSPPQQNNDDGSGSWRGRAFQTALSSAGDTIDAAVSGALNFQRRSLAGVDIKI